MPHWEIRDFNALWHPGSNSSLFFSINMTLLPLRLARVPKHKSHCSFPTCDYRVTDGLSPRRRLAKGSMIQIDRLRNAATSAPAERCSRVPPSTILLLQMDFASQDPPLLQAARFTNGVLLCHVGPAEALSVGITTSPHKAEIIMVRKLLMA